MHSTESENHIILIRFHVQRLLTMAHHLCIRQNQNPFSVLIFIFFFWLLRFQSPSPPLRNDLKNKTKQKNSTFFFAYSFSNELSQHFPK
jgi:hypothetical protein